MINNQKKTSSMVWWRYTDKARHMDPYGNKNNAAILNEARATSFNYIPLLTPLTVTTPLKSDTITGIFGEPGDFTVESSRSNIILNMLVNVTPL